MDVTNTAGAIDGDTWTAGILTRGARAYGVLAQSIGGGGGLGGTATGDSRSALVTEGSEDTDIGTPHSTITVGSGGGQSGSGGSVTVGNSGVIATRGYGSHAIVAQVIGGGGGVGADGSVDTDVSMSLGSNITDGIGAAAGAASGVTGRERRRGRPGDDRPRRCRHRRAIDRRRRRHCQRRRRQLRDRRQR